MNEQDLQKKTESDIEEFINKTKASLEKSSMSTSIGEEIGIVEKVFDCPLDDVMDQFALLQNYLLDLGDEARDLIDSLE